MSRIRSMIFAAAALAVSVLSFGPAASGQATRPLTLEDMMAFRTIQAPVISPDGAWVAFEARPDRGDGDGRVIQVGTGKTITVARGARPVFSGNSRWAAFSMQPRAVDLEKTGADRPKPGLAVCDLAAGTVVALEKVEGFAFSEDGLRLAIQFAASDPAPKPETPAAGTVRPEPAAKPPAAKAEAKPKLESGSDLVLRDLESGAEVRIAHVAAFAFDKGSRFLAYAVAESSGQGNGLFVRDLGARGLPDKAVVQTPRDVFRSLTWDEVQTPAASARKGSAPAGPRLAFVAAAQDDEGRVETGRLIVWNGGTGSVIEAPAAALPEGWAIPAKNRLSWTKDGRRLFLGLKPLAEIAAARPPAKMPAAEPKDGDLRSREAILAKREVDVWHWNDPLINPHQKKSWNQAKDRTYAAVFHVDARRLVPLADEAMPAVETGDGATALLGSSNVPYLREITWDGGYQDIYLVNPADGSRRQILTRLESRPSLSPGGRYVVYYDDGEWRLFDPRSGRTLDLTGSLGVPFADEDHDTPDEPRGYGVAGWLDDESAVLVYDKFDVWQFSMPGGDAVNLTAGRGRTEGIQFRVVRLDPEGRTFGRGEALLLSASHERDKHTGFYAARVGSPGVEKRLEEKKMFRFLAKAKNADVLLYTRESYTEFPDLWASGPDFAAPRKLTDLGAQTKGFGWGSAELVEWTSADGRLLQGVLIKPGDFQPGRRYPVIVYFYELMAQRLYEFNQVVVNHRPCFPHYASHGYAIFLPDVRFEVGRPGLSAVKCIVPGVQKLVDMGVADPARVALHGHSWSGYQTAQVITQTDIFACAVAGAAVTNMTSAYGGIRWESGMARPFQYEKTQSRIGPSLYENRDLYIENSPVFYADRIRTPLLLMFGDEDGAVPWYQGIELYLAMRRLGKDCVFLQYRGEPHHPQKYPNKLDYSIRMKEYFDHYLKGAPAAEWIEKGIPYSGR